MRGSNTGNREMEELLSATDSENKLQVGFDEISEVTQQLLAAQSSIFPALSHTQLCSHFLPSASLEIVCCLGQLIQLPKVAETTPVGRKRGRNEGMKNRE